ncbi:FkbM family methyltransferase [candidate division CSSED10-310 bacterium]|uniref:FkbM family methyltransferase n=1 Tax=candidate division CSSED10-310 bacterium TaxID=2855610 RepID=A0ABV6YYH3_UNCC1
MKSTKAKKTNLSDGRVIWCLNKNEAKFVWEQVNDYFKYEIAVSDGDTIIDVGANIGLFALAAWDRCKPQGKVYALEPIPVLCDILNRNMKVHQCDHVTVLAGGVSNVNGTLTFTYFPRITIFSTAFSDDLKAELQHSFEHTLADSSEEKPRAQKLFGLLPGSVRSYILKKLLNYYLGHSELVECQVWTISHLLQQYSIQSVDLLKIDVEKSEMDVLFGIEEHDDINDRLNQVRVMLQTQGFHKIHIDQERTSKGSTVYSVYARRE